MYGIYAAVDCRLDFRLGSSISGHLVRSLVDSSSYAAEERNVNPRDSLTAVDRGKYQEFWYCFPTKKTRLFAVVQNDGAVVQLDAATNPKIEEVVRQAGKQSPFAVTSLANGATVLSAWTPSRSGIRN